MSLDESDWERMYGKTPTVYEETKMTNEDILKLAETCGFDTFQIRNYDGESDYGAYWECWEEELLKFALLIHENGYNKGYNKASYDAELYEHAGNSYD